jgi:hypothetical protein
LKRFSRNTKPCGEKEKRKSINHPTALTIQYTENFTVRGSGSSSYPRVANDLAEFCLSTTEEKIVSCDT